MPKIRVVPFNEDCTWYVVQYRRCFIWFDVRNSFLWKSLDLTCYDQPMIYNNYQEACDVATKLSKEGALEMHLKQNDISYDFHIKKLKRELKQRNKTFEV